MELIDWIQQIFATILFGSFVMLFPSMMFYLVFEEVIKVWLTHLKEVSKLKSDARIKRHKARFDADAKVVTYRESAKICSICGK